MEAIILPLLVIVFLAIPLLQMRKQNKQLNDIRAFQAQIAVGQRVKTTSGLFATVVALNEDHVRLNIAPGVEVEWDRAALLQASEPTTGPAVTEHTEGQHLPETHGHDRAEGAAE